MNLPTIAFAGCVVLVAALSARTYLGSRALSPRNKTLLLGLRGIALALVVLLFFDPSFRLESLQTSQPRPVVLLDRSQSMQLFDPDSVAGLVEQLSETWRNTPFRIMLFGDSLRADAQTNSRTLPVDHHSWFPAVSAGPLAEKNARILVVSDGNWSNSVIPQIVFEGRPCAYVKLPPPRLRPYLTVRSLAQQVVGTEFKRDTIGVVLSGYLPVPRSIVVACSHGPKKLASRTINRQAGYAIDTLNLVLAPLARGRRLCAISVGSAPDSLRSGSAVLITTLPTFLTVRSLQKKPRIDSRFLSLAFRKDPTWIPATASVAHPDLLLTFDWSDRIAAQLQNSPRAAVLFAGCVPGEYAPLPKDAFRGAVPSQYLRPRNTRNAYPPLEQLIRATTPVLSAPQTAWSVAAATPDRGIDTIPLLQSGYWHGHPATIVYARDIWKWDFLTLTENTAAKPVFSDLFRTTVREQVIAGLASSLIVYPVAAPLMDELPSVWAVALPGALDPETTTNLTLSFAPLSGGQVFDTALVVVPGTTPQVTVAPFAPGPLVVSAQLSARSPQFSTCDTFMVEPNNSELQVLEQNTVLLDQIGIELPWDTAAIAAFFDMGIAPDAAVMVSMVRLPRTWLILLLTTVAFCLEWALRRHLRLD